MAEVTERFVKFLQGQFGQQVTVEDAATDVLRQPLFPGLDTKPQELMNMANIAADFPEYMAGMDMLPPGPTDDGMM